MSAFFFEPSVIESIDSVDHDLCALQGLKLNQFVSEVSSAADSNATYDLFAVSNHYGSMAWGHYTAACRVGLPGGKEQWYNFNDDAVTKLAPQSVVTSCAYMVFYVRTE